MQLLETSETGISDTRFTVTGFSVDVLKQKASANITQVFQKLVFSETGFSGTGFQLQVFQKPVFQKQDDRFLS